MTVTYEAIATYTAPSAQANYTFTSIPATYTDLILVMSYSLNTGTSSTFMRFNGDTTSNYSDTYLAGHAISSAISGRDSSSSNGIRIAAVAVGAADNSIRTTIVAVQNYANTTTFKTALVRDNQAANETSAIVGLWRKTPEAINSIFVFNGASANFNTGSTFTLYGIKAE
jgi:hypothetical protein